MHNINNHSLSKALIDYNKAILPSIIIKESDSQFRTITKVKALFLAFVSFISCGAICNSPYRKSNSTQEAFYTDEVRSYFSSINNDSHFNATYKNSRSNQNGNRIPELEHMKQALTTLGKQFKSESTAKHPIQHSIYSIDTAKESSDNSSTPQIRPSLEGLLPSQSPFSGNLSHLVDKDSLVDPVQSALSALPRTIV